MGWLCIVAAVIFGLLAKDTEDPDTGVILAFVSLAFLALGIVNVFK